MCVNAVSLCLSIYSWFSSTKRLQEGRSDAQFKYVEMKSDEVGDDFSERYFKVAQNIPVKTNFYFSLFHRGRQGYDPVTKPHLSAPYLSKENFDKLKVQNWSVISLIS